MLIYIYMYMCLFVYVCVRVNKTKRLFFFPSFFRFYTSYSKKKKE